ncbi:Maintenance of telomere capping protein 6 [Bienertia sinuspersici]
MAPMALSAASPFPVLFCNNPQLPPKLSFSLSNHHYLLPFKSLSFSPKFRHQLTIPCSATRKSSNNSSKNSRLVGEEVEDESFPRKLTQTFLWAMEGVYILWLFLLPYAPGDPVWAISSDTINSLVDLSLNFFFILPITNLVGIHAMEAPVLHPISEGLFNFAVGWTFMFAPLLYTDIKNGRYKGSLDALWGLQMFLTNTFLIPYMAIRLNEADASSYPKKKRSQLGIVMIKGAPVVGLVGGIVCAISILWALFGRADGDFGSVNDRWDFLLRLVGSERFAYAFVWDIVLYMIFQPWLISGNLENVAKSKILFVSYVRYIPVVGLLAYLLCLNREEVCRAA